MICDEVDVCEQIGAPEPRETHAYPRPDYSQRFRCLAHACEENCCSGWSVPVDRQTLLRFHQHPTLKPFAEALIVLNTQASTPGSACMPLDHQGTCAFLNEEKLCGIHRHFGPSMLPDACATYPREFALQSTQREASLNLSCPEAARLTLLDPNLLGSGPWQVFGPRRYAHLPQANRLPSYFDPLLALREFTLLLITDPTYLLWQRLHHLRSLAHHLETVVGLVSVACWAEDHPADLATLIAQHAHSAANHLDELPDFEPDPALQLRFTAEVLRTRLSEPNVPEPFLAMVRTFQRGLGCNPANPVPTSDHQIAHNFANAYRFHARPLLDRHPHLIENFVVNHIFKYAYVSGRSQTEAEPASPTTQHLALVANVALVQSLVVGLAAHHREELESEHVVRLIQSVSKAIEHHPASVAHLTQTMRDQDLVAPIAQGRLLHLA